MFTTRAWPVFYEIVTTSLPSVFVVENQLKWSEQ